MSDSKGNNNMTKGRKRNYHHAGSNTTKSKYQPKRGAPGILLTCDTGRDKKAKREGLQIMNYYYKQECCGGGKKEDDKMEEEEDTTNNTKDAKLSLEDELAELKKDAGEGNSKPKFDYGPFSEYETGCRGTIFLMCHLPDCSLVPIPKAKKEVIDGEGDAATSEEPDAKKVKTEEEPKGEDDKKEEEKETEETTPENDNHKTLWDPTLTVRRAMEDLQKESESGQRNFGVPGSRFVVRMIPMQATCFASIDEITVAFRALLDHWVLPRIPDKSVQKSYAIKFKKRHCSGLERDQVIDAIVGQVDIVTKGFENKEWKVDLGNPDYRIQVEVCKTLCGISVLKASAEDERMVKHNYNIVDMRAAAMAATQTGIDKKEGDGDNGDKKEEKEK